METYKLSYVNMGDVAMAVDISVLLLSCSISSGALESPSLHLSYSENSNNIKTKPSY